MSTDISKLIDSPILNNIMSKYARALRDEIFTISYKYGASRMGEQERIEFVQKMLSQYNPINFEKAIFYHHPNVVLEGVYRAPSAKFYEKQKPGEDKPPWQRGSPSESSTRSKKVDWLEVAKFDSSVWYDTVEFPRSNGGIDPKDFEVHEKAFTNMYAAFTHWFIIDFNFKALYFIWDCAKKYSIDFVVRCLDLVEDPRKHNTDYIKSIIEKEWAIMLKQYQEHKELDERSKIVTDQLLNLIEDRDPIDWEAIDKELEADITNKEMFDKVKLS